MPLSGDRGMEGGESLPFPPPLERALLAIRAAAALDLVTVVHRRRHRREFDGLAVRRADVVGCLLGLNVEDYRDGPHPDHHQPEHDVWIFGPRIGGRQMYVKVAIGRERTDGPLRIVVWSFHPAKHAMPPRDPR